ncbi:MAG: hypothetical protein ACI86M_001055 [Saprospiraceae bacterium]|jgi:hypothetical protein
MKCIIFFFAFFTTFNSNAQSVIASGGQSGISNTIYASATIGEAIIGSSTSQNHYGNQGFQQALDPEFTSTLEIDVEIYQITLSPNPTSEILNIKLDKPAKNNIHISILDINGATYKSVQLDQGNQNYTFNINRLLPGVYLLSLRSKYGITSTAYRFVKL